ncbi:hypothetical protein JAO78_005025 [Alishewanella sp. 16-MA]|uniref:Mu-like prophage FluMu N-terminal domain-containing protein n=1 Tax=Alishewanella maricola TaxID=2795740 RepID=A0ABS8C1G5_9ALTE|nr:hypothetical protein [Alishewanella maricola]MCB5226173.1 hypothetical protein [Alishewanella maricola]
MSKVLVIYALAVIEGGSFRRANTAFTATGTAFPAGHFSEQQLTAIYAEKRLSVREVDADKVPTSVDTRLLEGTATDPANEKSPTQQNQDDSPAAETLEQAFSLLDPSNKDHFTNAGVPQLDVLSRLLKRPVKADERNAAWATFQTAQGGNQ